MRRATEKARWEFIETMSDHVPHTSGLAIRGFTKKLMRYGATLGRIAENQCNGYQTWDGREDTRTAEREELKEQRIRAKVEDLCNMFGCVPVFQGDPRGNVLKIQVPDGYTNDWGREGICVPTS